ncbi:MAG: hypothetical protein CFE25_04870 [Chitinophagaceae bacterium BSSC1]|nr:MAG: hypothetical protein CFE25_04870 [Chitinophagaceae bacterium BSSC1]
MMRKKYLFSFLLFQFLSNVLFAQQVVTFRNQNWQICNEKEALYVSVNEPENGLWHRKDYFLLSKKLQMDGYYKDSASTIQHGKFTYYYPNKSVETISYFENNQKQGEYFSFYPNGIMRDSFHFKQDIPIGICSGWYPNGYIRVEMQMDTIGKGKGLAIGFFENGNTSFKGLFNEGLRKSGNWFYYHENGNKASVIQFPKTDSTTIIKPRIKFDQFESIYYDSTINYYNAFCYDQNGYQLDSCRLINKGPEFRGGIKAWTSYLEGKMFEITRTLTGDPGYINIKYRAMFMINAKGATSQIMLDNAVEEKMDEKVGDIIRNSKNWIPAKHNNRIIPFLHTQSMTFMLNVN